MDIPSYEEDLYRYNLAFDDNEFDDNFTTEEQCALTSNTADRVAVILSVTAPAGNSVSSSRVGGEPAVLHPKTIAEFRLAMDAMEAAHHEGNDQKMGLLASIRKVVSLAHKSGKNQSPLKKSITHTWQVPEWLPTTHYDQSEGKHIPLNFMIGQQHKYREWCDRRN